MKDINVFLQYPWGFPDSPYYKYLVDYPPSGINYLNSEKQRGAMTKKRGIGLSNFLKIMIRKTIKMANIPIINIHETGLIRGYDLIHCAHCLSKNDFPWVTDIESLWQIYGSGQETSSATKRIRSVFLGENCKKIILWTKNTETEFKGVFPEAANKSCVVYPAVPLPIGKKMPHKGINLLFVGRSFYEKGGLDALRAIDNLTKKYSHVRAMIVSEVPEKVMKEYRPSKKISFLGLMPKKDLEKIYAKSDIFIYPGYTDTFGFGILECMSWGIPSISVSGALGKDSKNEIINSGINGFVVNPPKKNLGRIRFSWSMGTMLSEFETNENQDIIREIEKKASVLIENASLRKKMSKICVKEVKEGKFSIEKRNKKLEKIYKEAID